MVSPKFDYGLIAEVKVEIAEGSLIINGEVLTIDQVDCIDLLEPGSNAIVAKAVDKVLNREVVLKVWITQGRDRRDKVQQGLAEAQKLAQLSHPNIATIYYAGLQESKVFAVMEYVNGSTLRSWLTGQPKLEFRYEVWNLINEAIGYAHSCSVMHGDLHDRNVLIIEGTRGGTSYPIWIPKVIDFGTSIFAEERGSKQREVRGLMSLTRQLLFEYASGDDLAIDLTKLPDDDAFNAISSLGEALHSLARLSDSSALKDSFDVQTKSRWIGLQIGQFPVFDLDTMFAKFSDAAPYPNAREWFESGLYAGTFFGLNNSMESPPFDGDSIRLRRLYLLHRSRKYG